MPIQEIEERIRTKLIDGEHFDPKVWNIPRLTFDSFDPDLDHEWMEFEKVAHTSDNVTDKRSIINFLEEISEKEPV